MELGKLLFREELSDSGFVEYQVEVANNQWNTTIGQCISLQWLIFM